MIQINKDSYLLEFLRGHMRPQKGGVQADTLKWIPVNTLCKASILSRVLQKLDLRKIAKFLLKAEEFRFVNFICISPANNIGSLMRLGSLVRLY
jgi:hypothetical protein